MYKIRELVYIYTYTKIYVNHSKITKKDFHINNVDQYIWKKKNCCKYFIMRMTLRVELRHQLNCSYK